jgi:hypothetical protein
MLSTLSLLSASQRVATPAGVSRQTPTDAKGQTASTPPQVSDLDAERLQRAEDALNLLESTAVDIKEQRKARAEAKLEEAKAELLMLKQFGFPPEVIARRAAQLGITIAGAAAEFAESMGTGNAATSQATGNQAAGGKTTTTDVASTDQEPPSSEGAENRTVLPVAYQEVINHGRHDKAPSNEDRQTLVDFKSTLEEIKAMLEKALRDMKAQENDDAAAGAENALSAIGSAQSSLSRAAMAMPAISVSLTL